MTLIKSISGIRGTIGGKAGEGLSPVDVVKFVSAYSEWVKETSRAKRPKVVTGRDARISGDMVMSLVNTTLTGMGIDVISLGLASTPTVEIAVVNEKADGGIIITASHNPGNWNALKLLDSRGEFLSAREGEKITGIADAESFFYSPSEELGNVTVINDYDNRHIDMILALGIVDREAIERARFRVAVDCVNSVGGNIVPLLLKKLGVKEVTGINMVPDGIFSHNPEPVPANLDEISRLVEESKSDVGFVVDPDVDRLAIISEDGSFFNEEYTLVACADYLLSLKPGNTVSNMSSSRALRDITLKHGGSWQYSAVGEVNVVAAMKETNAVIGGEGNGGVILPELHYGRDALVGIALFLSLLAGRKVKCSDLRRSFPEYVISKNRIDIDESVDPQKVLAAIEDSFGSEVTDRRDGLLIENQVGWVQVRKSNTESILRIYSEGRSKEEADLLAEKIIKIVKKVSES